MTRALFLVLIVSAAVLVAWRGTNNYIAVAEVHSGNIHNCDDFTSQAEAQAHLQENPSDPDILDRDNDNVACEKLLPCPCDPPDAANGEVQHTGDLHDCEDFSFAGAQLHLALNPSDPDNLDADNDGTACDENAPGTPTTTRTPTATRTPTPRAVVSATGGNLCHEQCRPGAPECENLRNSGFLYTQCQDSLNHSPGFNRPVAMTFLVPNSTMPCGGQTHLVARLVYPDGVGAPNRVVTFQSSLGTVESNLLSDYAGYVQTAFAAPLSPAVVQIDAIADGLTQSLRIKVECAPPPAALLTAPSAPSAPTSVFTPPKTGDAGLAE